MVPSRIKVVYLLVIFLVISRSFHLPGNWKSPYFIPSCQLTDVRVSYIDNQRLVRRMCTGTDIDYTGNTRLGESDGNEEKDLEDDEFEGQYIGEWNPDTAVDGDTIDKEFPDLRRLRYKYRPYPSKPYNKFAVRELTRCLQLLEKLEKREQKLWDGIFMDSDNADADTDKEESTEIDESEIPVSEDLPPITLDDEEDEEQARAYVEAKKLRETQDWCNRMDKAATIDEVSQLLDELIESEKKEDLTQRTPMHRLVYGDTWAGHIDEKLVEQGREAHRLRLAAKNISQAEINQNKINAAIKKWQRHEGDHGSSEAQVAMAHERIQQLTAHLLANRHDYSSHRALDRMVHFRRKQLNYLYTQNATRAMEMVEALGIRFTTPGDTWRKSVKYGAFKNTKTKFKRQKFSTFLKESEKKSRKKRRNAARRAGHRTAKAIRAANKARAAAASGAA